ncbi:7SK snRNA methylphosphate capping enzyme [Malaclemys terrapin pileata]|uniref:7SK snRNA methylphosphate capping enzyme n=1 Tax=Malaclemys terrapin pileata TaxID=2991368 RepID=UPI0023A8C62F|nr:7SK snRNA methylphosphate capping enzyme [Malaclemys terrapin pileata]
MRHPEAGTVRRRGEGRSACALGPPEGRRPRRKASAAAPPAGGACAGGAREGRVRQLSELAARGGREAAGSGARPPAPMQEMIEMAADKETFLVPAPPPPLKPPPATGGGGGGPLVQLHEEAASTELHEEAALANQRREGGGPPRGEGGRRGGGPLVQLHEEAAPLGQRRGGNGPPGRPHQEAALHQGAGPKEEDSVGELQRPRNGFQTHRPAGGKRRNSCNVGFKHPASKRRRRVNSECDPVLPSEFLLGGNIFDPLNLNSLLDEEVNQALNAETPKSSPLPAKGRDPVEILIPKDITDPLSLNAQDGDAALVLASPFKTGRKRHRHRGQQRGSGGGAGDCKPAACPTPQPYELNTAINCRDEVVSPLLPLAVEGAGCITPSCASSSSSRHHRKRRRTCSKSEAAGGAKLPPPPPTPGGGKGGGQPGKSSPEKGKGAGRHQQLPTAKRRRQQRKFQYGNYCKYYGYRNPNCEDARLRVMKPEWFQGKEVLDLGCNVGHLTLSVAKKWKPARVVGLDIDGALIHSARQNIRHYLSEEIQQRQEDDEEAPEGAGSKRRRGCFPASLAASRGPIAAPRVPQDGAGAADFPDNVIFVRGNYVLERDELLETQGAEFDMVLCLSLTKWVHLNWGDDGLKRLFKRIFRHLRPGGLLLLEPQPWSSYGKRKNLTETIYRNYYRIKLKPEQFPSYLTSPEVGFSSCELVARPYNSSRGFQRPIYLLHKGHPATH